MNQEIFNNYSLNLSIIIFLLTFLFKLIINDINNKKINIIILPNLLITSLINITIPIYFLSGCYLFDYCFSDYIDIEKYIYIKSFRLIIVILLGYLSGIYVYRTYRLKSLNKFFEIKYLYLKPNLRLGLLISFIVASLAFILLGRVVGDLYYIKFISRLYNYYNWFLFTPVILFEISKNKLKDLKFLSLSYSLHGLVLFFGFGRTQNSLILLTFAFFIFLSSLKKDLNIRGLISILFRNINGFIISSSGIIIYISLFRIKYIEWLNSMGEFDSVVPLKVTRYLQASITLGFPIMNTFHFVNAAKTSTSNFITFNMFPRFFTEMPLFGSIFKNSDLNIWLTKLPEKLLGFKHEGEFGGLTFGSDFTQYAYGNQFISCVLAFLISLVNIYFIYLLAENISIILKDFFKKDDNFSKNISIRPSIFLITNISLSSVIQYGFLHSMITLIPFYLLSNYFTKDNP